MRSGLLKTDYAIASTQEVFLFWLQDNANTKSHKMQKDYTKAIIVTKSNINEQWCDFWGLSKREKGSSSNKHVYEHELLQAFCKDS